MDLRQEAIKSKDTFVTHTHKIFQASDRSKEEDKTILYTDIRQDYFVVSAKHTCMHIFWDIFCIPYTSIKIIVYATWITIPFLKLSWPMVVRHISISNMTVIEPKVQQLLMQFHLNWIYTFFSDWIRQCHEVILFGFCFFMDFFSVVFACVF